MIENPCNACRLTIADVDNKKCGFAAFSNQVSHYARETGLLPSALFQEIHDSAELHENIKKDPTAMKLIAVQQAGIQIMRSRGNEDLGAPSLCLKETEERAMRSMNGRGPPHVVPQAGEDVYPSEGNIRNPSPVDVSSMKTGVVRHEYAV